MQSLPAIWQVNTQYFSVHLRTCTLAIAGSYDTVAVYVRWFHYRCQKTCIHCSLSSWQHDFALPACEAPG